MAKLSDKKKTTSFVSAPQSVDKAGFITETAAGTVPDGWLECNGSAVSRTTYAELFAAIGTTYGVGDGSTTFNLPNRAPEIQTEWIDASSATFTNLTAITDKEIYYRRVGTNMEIMAKITASGPTGAGGNNVSLDLNQAAFGNVTVDESVLAFSTENASQPLGIGRCNAGGTSQLVYPRQYSTISEILFLNYAGTDNIDGSEFSSGQRLSFQISVPISGWSQANSDGKVIIKAYTDKAGSSVGVENLSIENNLTVNNTVQANQLTTNGTDNFQYEETTVTLTGNGALTGTVKFTRVGNMVTAMAVGQITHASGSDVYSNVGVIPESFRPTDNVRNISFIILNDRIQQFAIDSSGRIGVTYWSSSFGLVNETGTLGIPSISYLIT